MVDHYKLFADQIIAKEVYNESDDTVYTIVPCSSGMDACPGTDGYYAMIWHNASGFSSKFFKLSVVKKEEIADYCTADRMCDEIITDTKSAHVFFQILSKFITYNIILQALFF